MNKKLLLVLCATLLILASCGSSSNSDSRTLGSFEQAFIDAGYELEDKDTPLFSFVGASNGTLFYIDGYKVAIYEYEDEKAVDKALDEYSILSDMVRSGKFVLETSHNDVAEVFKGVS